MIHKAIVFNKQIEATQSLGKAFFLKLFISCGSMAAGIIFCSRSLKFYFP